MRQRLAAVGLLDASAAAAELTLLGFVDGFIRKRTDVEPATRTEYARTRRHLARCFGERPLASITAAHADEFRRHLLREELAPNTVRRTMGIAKQLFATTIEAEIIGKNPFAKHRGAVKGNAERLFFVTSEAMQRVVDACPDHEWRLLVALCRWGGSRCPSEPLDMRWGDVDWANNRMVVPSPKTAHLDGHASRVVPIFPELRPFLTESFELAPERAEWLISRYRDPAQNLQTQFRKIILRAGLQPWPKLFQNLRSSLETELAESFPIHVV